MCFDTSSSTNCRSSWNPTNVPWYDTIDSKSYTWWIGTYVVGTLTKPPYFLSNYTGTYMVSTSFTFTPDSFAVTDSGCNVFPYYSIYASWDAIPNLTKYDNTFPRIFTVDKSTPTDATHTFSSTNFALPERRSMRVGQQFISNVFMVPGDKLLITIWVQWCNVRADQTMEMVTNNQKKMTISVVEL
jgi:hypothetical protein